MEALLGTLALFVFGGLATYTICERKHRARWRRFEQQPVEHEAAPFRRDAGPAPTRAVLVQHRAYKLIRRTALWSIYMGQMAVPGGLLGLIGVFLGAGLGLLSIPGMMLAVRIWRLGYALLRRDPNAEHEARALHRFAVRLNTVTYVLAAVLPLFGVEFFILSAVLVGYGAISFAHAQAMLRCAELLAADQQLRERSRPDLERPPVTTVTLAAA